MNYVVSQPVQVHSYGAWRSGVVIKVGRTRVTVRYIKNLQGDAHTKTFTTDRIRRPQK